MSHAAAFALGVLAGLLVWLIARSIATPETASAPVDPYIDALLARERW